MKYKVTDDTILVRLDVGEEIQAQLLKIAEAENISYAAVSGIGATDAFTVGVFDLDKKDYDRLDFSGNHEITALCGSLTRMNGQPYVHLHINCANSKGQLVGGHLLSARISVTAELVLTCLPCIVERQYEESLHFNGLVF